MIIFYSPDIRSTGMLSETESGHCCRVLRLREGDHITVADGFGHFFECEISDAHPKHTSVMILDCREVDRHWSPKITLAVAPTKNMDRMEWLAEKAVEIGVDRLVFVDCQRNVRHVVKRDRIEKIMISAMKQSLKAHLPELVELVSFRQFLASDSSQSKYMGYCDPNIQRRDFSVDYDGKKDLTILVGPEGDFSPEEVDAALTAGFVPVTFGNTRLRTETAALYALCATHSIITQQV
ncbi:MAG: RsmE family RNA methyltransferase [Lepagella sp.]